MRTHPGRPAWRAHRPGAVSGSLLWTPCFSDHSGGPQDSPAAAARYLRNSGQCSYLVGGFWWVPGDHDRQLADGTRRYAGGHAWTMDEAAAKNTWPFRTEWATAVFDERKAAM